MVTYMGPRNAYKDMVDIVVSPITCVSMNHQNQLQHMTNGVMFATICYHRYCTSGRSGLEYLIFFPTLRTVIILVVRFLSVSQ
jgi:hypothetical protein